MGDPTGEAKQIARGGVKVREGGPTGGAIQIARGGRGQGESGRSYR